MRKNTSIFTKEMADLLSKIRKKAYLSQKEIAERIGLSAKSFAYISFLESGKIKNPILFEFYYFLSYGATSGF